MPATATAPDPNELYTAWESFGIDNNIVQRGETLRGDSMEVQRAPGQFVRFGTPTRDWPSSLDRAISENAARDAAQAEERRVRFEQAARANRVKLEPKLHKATRDIVTYHNGAPATIERGSIVVAGDPLLAEHADAFRAS
jgi:hypothetical protein